MYLYNFGVFGVGLLYPPPSLRPPWLKEMGKREGNNHNKFFDYFLFSR